MGRKDKKGIGRIREGQNGQERYKKDKGGVGRTRKVRIVSGRRDKGWVGRIKEG